MKVKNKYVIRSRISEAKFRFNNRKQNIYKILLGIFRKELLKLS